MFRKKVDWNNPDDIIAYLAGQDSTEWSKFADTESEKNITLLIERIREVTIPKILSEIVQIDKNDKRKYEDTQKIYDHNIAIRRASQGLSELNLYLTFSQLKKYAESLSRDYNATCEELAETKKELAALKAKYAEQECTTPSPKP